jgi:hypothetical protein
MTSTEILTTRVLPYFSFSGGGEATAAELRQNTAFRGVHN